VGSADAEMDAKTSCVICMQPYRRGELLKALPCGGAHFFHPACIARWLIGAQPRRPNPSTCCSIEGLRTEQPHHPQPQELRALSSLARTLHLAESSLSLLTRREQPHRTLDPSCVLPR
jgi:hypothetical protein